MISNRIYLSRWHIVEAPRTLLVKHKIFSDAPDSCGICISAPPDPHSTRPQLHENAYQADRSKLAQERAALSAELAAARQSLAAVETEHRALHASASSSVGGAARANAFERLRVQESALVRSRGLMCRFCNFACSQ